MGRNSLDNAVAPIVGFLGGYMKGADEKKKTDLEERYKNFMMQMGTNDDQRAAAARQEAAAKFEREKSLYPMQDKQMAAQLAEQEQKQKVAELQRKDLEGEFAAAVQRGEMSPAAARLALSYHEDARQASESARRLDETNARLKTINWQQGEAEAAAAAADRVAKRWGFGDRSELKATAELGPAGAGIASALAAQTEQQKGTNLAKAYGIPNGTPQQGLGELASRSALYDEQKSRANATMEQQKAADATDPVQKAITALNDTRTTIMYRAPKDTFGNPAPYGDDLTQFNQAGAAIQDLQKKANPLVAEALKGAAVKATTTPTGPKTEKQMKDDQARVILKYDALAKQVPMETFNQELTPDRVKQLQPWMSKMADTFMEASDLNAINSRGQLSTGHGFLNFIKNPLDMVNPEYPPPTYYAQYLPEEQKHVFGQWLQKKATTDRNWDVAGGTGGMLAAEAGGALLAKGAGKALGWAAPKVPGYQWLTGVLGKGAERAGIANFLGVGQNAAATAGRRAATQAEMKAAGSFESKIAQETAKKTAVRDTMATPPQGPWTQNGMPPTAQMNPANAGNWNPGNINLRPAGTPGQAPPIGVVRPPTGLIPTPPITPQGFTPTPNPYGGPMGNFDPMAGPMYPQMAVQGQLPPWWNPNMPGAMEMLRAIRGY